jgi:hypothetical protein
MEGRNEYFSLRLKGKPVDRVARKEMPPLSQARDYMG